MAIMSILPFALLLGVHVAPTFVDVFRVGEHDFASIRIPSIVISAKGTALAFAEGRSGTASDQANNKIILKRSRDGGRTWGDLQVIADDGANSLNNPCAVVDTSNGRIFLMYQRIPAGLSEGSGSLADGYEGPHVYRSFVMTSDTDGRTWSAPLDVTRSVKHDAPVKTVCSGPGIGIQLTRGPHKGRLVFPFNEGPYWSWNNYAVYSDDHGATWHAGQNAPGALTTDEKGRLRSQVNEVQFVELADGSISLNSRRFAGAAVRKSAHSMDGGETWSPVEDVPDLVDSSCMGSILRYSFPGRRRRDTLLYSGPDDARNRVKGTLYASFDGGRTWKVKRTLYEGPFAYSVLTRFADGTIGCLFEADEYHRIVFARVSPQWLIP